MSIYLIKEYNFFNSSYFLVQSCHSQEGQTSSILTFWNRSIKLFTLKNHFLKKVKALHSMRICLMVQGIWHVKHYGCCSCFGMKEWVSLVWPICHWDTMTCSLLDFLKAGLYSPKVGLIRKSLLWMLLFQRCCNFVWRSLLILDFRSVYGILNLLEVRSKADKSLLFHFPSLQCGLESII